MNKITSIFVLAFFLLQTATTNAQNGVAIAQKQFELGAYDLALNSYKRSSENERKIDLNVELAQCLAYTGDLSGSSDHYQKFRKGHPDDTRMSYGYADVLMRMGKYEEAKQELSMLKASNDVIMKISSCDKALAQQGNEGRTPVALEINSKEADFGASFYKSGIVFNTYAKVEMSDRAAESVQRQVGFFLAQDFIPGVKTALINDFGNRKNIGAISIADEKSAYTKSTPLCQFANCRNKSASIYISQFDGKNFMNEKSFDHNQIGISNFDPHLSADGNTMYFASDRQGGFGGTDLYVSTFDGKQWSAPTNLGSEINTSGNEVSPFYQGDVLYFASDLREGFGGYDLFTAQQFGDGWLSPQNMGKGINSPGDETYPSLSIDGSDMLFTSNRSGGKGGEDVYRIDLPQRNIDLSFTNQDIPKAFDLASLTETKSVNVAEENPYAGARRVSLGHVISNTVANVYFIQLAAFNQNKTDFNRFKSLVKFGNIYMVNVGMAKKIRLGYFINENEARNVLSRVKTNGFSDAFIIADPLNTSKLELIHSTYDGAPSTKSTAPGKKDTFKNDMPEFVPSAADVSAVVYKVRLASYEDPIWFDSKKVKDIGEIEQWSKGFWTIFVLSGYGNFEEAEKARIKAVNRGYADAEVVVDNGGIIERLKKN